jgi:hypothetical protein|tara:strand:+ start:585 stop:902 length:318 start_codon:yes stop_codon:yes gene_type:complete
MNIKPTTNQINAIIDLSTKELMKRGDKKELNFYANPISPKNIVVKYVSYTLLGDNSIDYNYNVSEILPNGKIVNPFPTMGYRDKLHYLCELIEFDIDDDGKIILI